MKNDMRQSVDRAFAGATWDEAHARRVISRIEERKQPVMKRKLTVALVCALVLVLASACALAAVFVQRSERSNVVLTARNALTRQCRFTPGMLALFRADAQKKRRWGLYRYLYHQRRYSRNAAGRLQHACERQHGCRQLEL